MKLTSFLPAMLLMGLAGCASNYKAPDIGETAQLTISTDFARVHPIGFVSVRAVDPERCRAHPNGSRLAFFGTTVNADPHSGKVFRIEANREFVLTFRFTTGFATQYTCNVTAAFKPQVDKQYRAHFVVKEDSCHAMFAEAVHGSGAVDGWKQVAETRQIKPPCLRDF